MSPTNHVLAINKIFGCLFNWYKSAIIFKILNLVFYLMNIITSKSLTLC